MVNNSADVVLILSDVLRDVKIKLVPHSVEKVATGFYCAFQDKKINVTVKKIEYCTLTILTRT